AAGVAPALAMIESIEAGADQDLAAVLAHAGRPAGADLHTATGGAVAESDHQPGPSGPSSE
ncbi:MAG: hypothetical protein ACK5OX_10350, partial [Desertimonas sp.]